MHESPSVASGERFGYGVWVVTTLLLIALFGMVIVITLLP